jgi:hypothetical protein
VLGLALVVLALLLAPGAARAADPVPMSEYHGVNAQGLFRLPAWQWDTQLASIRALGLRVVRRDAFWSDAEARPPLDGVHRWWWVRHDAIAAALARNDLRWQPILDYGTPWATSTIGARAWMAPPDDPENFAAYAAAFAARYGPNGAFWAEHPELPYLPVTDYEIWNEPNLEQFWPGQDTAAERYADLFVAAARAVHATDPAGRVLVGGLSSTDVGDFVARMLARQPDLLSLADAVGFHPYGGDPSVTYARIAALRSVLSAAGAPGMPIEVTETGWASPPRPELRRAADLRRIAAQLPRSDCGVSRLIVYSWVTDELDPANPEDWFGIAHPDGSLTASAIAYAQGAAIGRTGTPGELQLCG